MLKTIVGWLELAVVVVAGAWTLVHLILSPGEVVADDYWGWALLGLFIIAVILAFVRYAQERAAFAARSGSDEMLPEPSVSRFSQARPRPRRSGSSSG